mgnify:CR=1 FL=1
MRRSRNSNTSTPPSCATRSRSRACTKDAKPARHSASTCACAATARTLHTAGCRVALNHPGVEQTTADAEVISVAAEALQAIGVAQPSFDLNMPQLVPLVCEGLEMDADTTSFARAALNRKDAGSIATLAGVDPNSVELLKTLVKTAGFAGKALTELSALVLPPAAKALIEDMETVVRHVQSMVPGMQLTVDPVEFRGAEYQTGISFTIFAEGA